MQNPFGKSEFNFFQHKFTSETPSYLHYDKTIPTKNNTTLRKPVYYKSILIRK